MQVNVQLRPEDLHHRRFRTEGAPLGYPGGRGQGLPPVGLSTRPGPDHPVDGLLVDGTIGGHPTAQVDEAVRGGGEPAGGSEVEASLVRGSCHGHRPAVTLLAQQVRLVYPATVEEHLGERRLAVEAAHRPALQAVAVGRYQQVGQPPVTLGLLVGTHQAEQPVCPGAARAPGLLPVEDEPLAVPFGPGGDSSQIAARIGF